MSDWIRCSHKLPDFDGLCIVHAPTMNEDTPLISLAWYNLQRKTFDGIPTCFTVDYWMELPEIPEYMCDRCGKEIDLWQTENKSHYCDECLKDKPIPPKCRVIKDGCYF